jgi:hypothetical protein
MAFKRHARVASWEVPEDGVAGEVEKGRGGQRHSFAVPDKVWLDRSMFASILFMERFMFSALDGSRCKAGLASSPKQGVVGSGGSLM